MHLSARPVSRHTEGSCSLRPRVPTRLRTAPLVPRRRSPSPSPAGAAAAPAGPPGVAPPARREPDAGVAARPSTAAGRRSRRRRDCRSGARRGARRAGALPPAGVPAAGRDRALRARRPDAGGRPARLRAGLPALVGRHQQAPLGAACRPAPASTASEMDHWQFPVGTKLWKEFSRDGVLLETRLIERYGPGREDYWMGAFVWKADGSEAVYAVDGADGRQRLEPRRPRGQGVRRLPPRRQGAGARPVGAAAGTAGRRRRHRADASAGLVADGPLLTRAAAGADLSRPGRRHHGRGPGLPARQLRPLPQRERHLLARHPDGAAAAGVGANGRRERARAAAWSAAGSRAGGTRP